MICALPVPPCLNGLGVENEVAADALRMSVNARTTAMSASAIPMKMALCLRVSIVVGFEHLVRLVDLEIDHLPAAPAGNPAGTVCGDGAVDGREVGRAAR